MKGVLRPTDHAPQFDLAGSQVATVGNPGGLGSVLNPFVTKQSPVHVESIQTIKSNTRTHPKLQIDNFTEIKRKIVEILFKMKHRDYTHFHK